MNATTKNMSEAYKQILLEAIESNQVTKKPFIRYDVIRKIIDDFVDQVMEDRSPFNMTDDDYYDIADRASDAIWDYVGKRGYIKVTKTQCEMFDYWMSSRSKSQVVAYVKKSVQQYIKDTGAKESDY